jgi:NAD(P)-dependent dehydrogenase (short-subunit alcohol dehydrogenase family)
VPPWSARAPTCCAPTSTEAAAAVAAAAGGPGARAARLDVTDAAAVQAAVDGVVARAGRLDLMFNNAGIAWGGDTELLTLDQWNAIIDVNIRGVVHGVAAAYPDGAPGPRSHRQHRVDGRTDRRRPDHQLCDDQARRGRTVAGAALGGRRPRCRVTALCPAAVETPILDKGAIGGFVGRDYYLKGQGIKTPYDADRLAQDPGGDRTQQGAADQAADGARPVAVRPAGAGADAAGLDPVRREPAAMQAAGGG